MEKKEKAICKILTVDNEMGVDTFFYEFFSRRNYEILCASSGEEALRIVKEEKPHIILLDIKMKGMDGLETLRRIKEINSDIKVIMVSAVNDDDALRTAKELGADDYITKPLSLKYLEKIILLKVHRLAG